MLSPFQLSLWIGLLALLGPLGSPLARIFFPSALDGASGAGRILALLLWMLVYWLGSLLFSIPANIAWAFISLGILCATLWTLGRKVLLLSEHRRGMVIETSIFVLVLGAFLWMRSWAGDIWQNEKFMDAMILKALLVSDHFPPEDRWFAGAPINYHYLGHLLFVPSIRVVAAPLEYAYNLALSSVIPILLGVLTTVLTGRGVRLVTALLFSGVAGVAGTWATGHQLWIHWMSGEPFSWWNTSREIPWTIQEVPFFSFLVGDLHAHFTSLSVTVLTVALILRWPEVSERKGRWVALTAGVLTGLHYGLNAWALPVTVTLVAMVWLLRWPQRPTWLQGACYLGASVLFSVPFGWSFVAPHTELRWLEAELRSPLGDWLLHWGAFVIPLFMISVRGWWARPTGERAAVAVLTGLLGWLAGVPVALVTLIAADLLHWRSLSLSFSSRTLLLMCMAVLAGCELIYIQETYAFFEPFPRSNTVFKFYYLAWVLFFMAGPELWLGLTPKMKHLARVAWILPLAFPVIALSSRNTTSRQTLDGLTWLKIDQPEDWKAIEWISQNLRASDRIVEAAFPSTHGTSPLSTFSGRPTILAWVGHQGIWRPHQAPELVQRGQDLEEIYSTADSARLGQLLAKYDVSLVALGSREKSRYPKASFEAVRKLPVRFQLGDLTIYDAKPAPLK